MELISPNPFAKAELGHFVPAGTTQGVKRAQEREKHLWEAGVIPLHTHPPLLSLLFLFSLFLSPPWSQGSVLKIHQQLS